MSCGFLQQLEATTDALHLDGTSILVAVSGGADSIALLRGLLELQTKRRLRILAAHLNHCLRGEESDRDAVWVSQTCKHLDITLIISSRNVRAAASAAKTGLEETARHMRHEFLLQSAIANKCSHIALAHTADDQAETILHHFVRGTGISGLRGMELVRETARGARLIRPILGATRREVEMYLRGIGQEWRIDASNEDASFTRNRIRSGLLPLIEREYNPQFRRALLRLGEQAREIELALHEIADSILQQALIVPPTDTVRLRAEVLRAQPRHVIRESFRQLWTDLGWPRQRMGFDHWNRLAEIAIAGGAATLPGQIEVRRRRGEVVLKKPTGTKTP